MRTVTTGAQHASSSQRLTAEEYTAARRTTINAHYTVPMIVTRMWEAVGRLGFDGGRVLEPGCGAGTFIGLAPPGVQMTGVELDPTTARIARALYPQAWRFRNPIPHRNAYLAGMPISPR